MKVFIAKNILGVFAFDENGTLVDYTIFQKEPKKISATIKELCTEEKKFLEKFKDYQIEDGGANLRRNLGQIMTKLGISQKEYYSFLKETSQELAKAGMQEISEDQMIIQGVETLADLEESINLLSERIREWYSLHFPELSTKIEDPEEFSKLIKEYGSREKFSGQLSELAKISIGADIDKAGEVIVSDFAAHIVSLGIFKKNLEEYISLEMKKIAPNLAGLLGPTLGARVISAAKGLENLAIMPGSKVQILGAERALFKHIKKKVAPPKHGVLFQYPLVKSSPWWQRGKIARSLAQKVSIAARADVFTGGYIAEELKKNFLERVEEIKKNYPDEPKKMRIIKYTPEKVKWRGKKRKR